MHIDTVLLILNLAAMGYLIWRKPRAAHSPVSQQAMQQGAKFATCGECGLTVARYTPREDGSVICANCSPKGK